MRSRRTPLIVAAVALFLAASFLVARYLAAENRERNLVIELLSAQARGDADAVIDRLDGCATTPGCAARTRAITRRVQQRPGRIRLVRLDSETARVLGAARGPTRVVWLVPGRGLTTVQCIDVQRTGNALRGRSVLLRGISAPIERLSSCPGQDRSSVTRR